ncbi:Signal transduction histidine kinase [Rhodoblastus acidophilus]|uniref:histidine kinase n=1 Tax=Rhodoblastus acidophilus TaxID=1074 RepID=A0A212S795_RHOAC|nr:HAMP domain-containing sensor histidine kinase [Rhodoblastus acidophilus]PPQ37231.1 sensor histidine kinase [Rhodoblastus acidophilus]RAI17301.1 sensor histidine kinase [Rhodoblastus acidophilus]SNB81036.1 Signal transduction histidine kinase [Rhodoblastus acidophilus]
MRRFYLRITLALFASLAVFALLAGLTAGLLRLFDEPAARSWPETTAEIAERLLPAGADRTSLASELAFWSERSRFDLALLSPTGDLIARAGDAHELPSTIPNHERRDRIFRAPGGIYALTFQDGRRLIAVPKARFDSVHALRFPLALLGLALAVAIGFYPLIRQLTRRLEQLEAGVAKFGEGDLGARVVVKGKDEIAKLAATFNGSADRIESLMNAHKLLLAHASHELRSPLSRLRMAIERLKNAPSDAAAQSETARNIAELDALVDEILLASRLQAAEPTKEPVDLAGLLAEECAAFDVEAVLANPAAAPMVEGDPRLLKRLFRNLLENASVHGGPDAPEAMIASGESEVRVSICDRGPGVSASDRETIFEPFHQGRASAGGAGLGLALVRQIAERHGGGVRCLPRNGGGACFEVELPLFVRKDAPKGSQPTER